MADLQVLLAAQDWRSQLAALTLIRRKGYSLPEQVLRVGTVLLSKAATQLGDDKWRVMEDVFYAALRCHANDWMTATLKAIKTQFGSTAKTMRMEAAVCEYTGNLQEANGIYEAIIKTTPHDQLSCKRRCALLKADGKVELALKALNSYLETFQGDLEAWDELADIYSSECHFQQAAFAYEEVLLASPQDFWVVLRYGEIVYSIGGLSNLLTARGYFAQAVLLNETCVRAMWALHQCCRQIDSLKPDPENTRMRETAEKQIRQAYSARAALLAAYPF